MPFDVVLDSDDNGSPGPFRFCNKITAGSGYTVQDGENILFHAGGEIELENGFVVEAGGAFTCREDY